jgi:hypothetical protein
MNFLYPYFCIYFVSNYIIGIGIYSLRSLLDVAIESANIEEIVVFADDRKNTY